MAPLANEVMSLPKSDGALEDPARSRTQDTNGTLADSFEAARRQATMGLDGRAPTAESVLVYELAQASPTS